MIRPGLTFALWCAIAVLVIVNDVIGDTWIAGPLPVRASNGTRCWCRCPTWR